MCPITDSKSWEDVTKNITLGNCAIDIRDDNLLCIVPVVKTSLNFLRLILHLVSYLVITQVQILLNFSDLIIWRNQLLFVVHLWFWSLRCVWWMNSWGTILVNLENLFMEFIFIKRDTTPWISIILFWIVSRAQVWVSFFSWSFKMLDIITDLIFKTNFFRIQR